MKETEMRPDQHSPTQPANLARAEPQTRMNSQQLFHGQKTVEIDHGDQRYTLRVTRDNKLILTK